MSFWVDTDGYSDREREMFVAGVEFQMVYDSVSRGLGWNQCIRSENAPRVRMMCAKLGVSFALRDEQHGWIQLDIDPATG